MSARRQEEDDEADVDVEVASNDSNGMHVDAPSADLAPDTHTLPGKISSNTMDVTDGSHHTAPGTCSKLRQARRALDHN